MGASDDSIREELIGEVLGQLSQLRRDVKELTQLLQASGKQFKDDGELTLLRFTSRSEQFLKDFSASTTDVLAEAGRFAERATSSSASLRCASTTRQVRACGTSCETRCAKRDAAVVLAVSSLRYG